MNAEVQAFIDKWAEKSKAKGKSLAAVGAAKLAEWNAENSLNDKDRQHYLDEAAEQWGVVEERGSSSGEEGRLYAEAFAIAEAYVASHPEQFVSFEDYVTPENHELLVKLIGTMGKAGREEEAAKLTMFELVRFERQHIGQAITAKVRKA